MDNLTFLFVFVVFLFIFESNSCNFHIMPKLRDGFKGQRTIIVPSFIIENLKQNPLGRLLYITDIGFYPNASYHFRHRTAMEATENILIYCIKGRGWYEIGDKRYNVMQNQFFILPRGVAHSYGSHENDAWSIYWLHFGGEMDTFFSKGFEQPTNIGTDNNRTTDQQEHLFEEIYRTLDNGFGYNNMMYATTSLFHFLGLMKYVGEYTTQNLESRNLDAPELAIQFMQKNLQRKLTLADIASEVKLSVSYFSNLFKEKTGFSPLQYLNLLRIRKACHYLDFSNMRINQICPLIGIEDNLYFSRLFTKIMGISPSQYRADKKG